MAVCTCVCVCLGQIGTDLVNSVKIQLPVTPPAVEIRFWLNTLRYETRNCIIVTWIAVI